MSRDARKLPSHLKKAASPLDGFMTYVKERRDHVGAAVGGVCEAGYAVSVGAGFDFGPLLTLGAPVVQVEVGAEITGRRSEVMFLLLMQQPSAPEPVALSVFTGVRYTASVKLEAKAGVGLPESWTSYVKDAGAATPATAPITSGEHVQANPLTEGAGGSAHHGLVTSPEAGSKSAEVADAPDDDSADDAEDASGLVVDARVTGTLSAAVAYDYVLLRAPYTSRFANAADEALRAELTATTGGTTKEEIKERAVDLLRECSVVLADPLAEQLARLEGALLGEDLATCKGVRDDLDKIEADARALREIMAAPAFLKEMTGYYPRARIDPAEGLDDRGATALLELFVSTVATRRSNPEWATWREEIVKLQGLGQKEKAQRGDTWKARCAHVLDSVGFPSAQPSKTQLTGKYTTANLMACMQTALDCIDRAARDDDKKRAEGMLGALARKAAGSLSSEDVLERRVVAKAEAASLLARHAPAMQFMPSWRLRGLPSSKELKRLLGEAKAKRTELVPRIDAMIVELTLAWTGEKREVKRRAKALLLSCGAGQKLPPFPRTPATKDLIDQLQALPPADAEKVAARQDLLDALSTFKDEQDELDRPASVTARLCYAALRSPSASVAAGVKARITARIVVGANEAGGQGQAAAGAGLEIRRSTSRLQTVLSEPPGPIAVQTQDVYVSSWSAHAEALAKIKLANRGKEKHAFERAFGMLAWRAGTLRWNHPAEAGAKEVVPLPGSGLNFGRSVKLERFLRKMGKLTPGQPPTPYVNRIARGLALPPGTLMAFLVDIFVPPASCGPLGQGAAKGADDIRLLHLEASWRLTRPDGIKFKVTWKSAPSPPSGGDGTYEVEDVRERFKEEFKRDPSGFELESISARYRIGDEVDKTRTMFQIANEYVVIASAKVERVRRASTHGLMEVVTWWPDPKSDAVERGDDEAARRALRHDAVPPTFLWSV